jgi:hypothetical protein
MQEGHSGHRLDGNSLSPGQAARFAKHVFAYPYQVCELIIRVAVCCF